MRSAFIESLTALAERDASVMLLTGDLGFTVFEPFRDRFQGRFINMGVAEQNMISVAAGLALCGRRVFVYSIIPFVTLRCAEFIRNDLCFHRANVCIVGVGSGYAYGHMGSTHHALEDIAILRSLPDMTVVCPGDPVETRAAMQAIATLEGPCYLRLGKNGEHAVHDKPVALTLGRTLTLREGSDATLIATGTMLETAVAAADLLKKNGVSARVLSMHTVKPLDLVAVRRAAAETALIVTIEEHRIAGGLGSAVAEVLAENDARPKQLFCSAPDTVSHQCASAEMLRTRAGLTAPLITERVLSALGR